MVGWRRLVVELAGHVCSHRLVSNPNERTKAQIILFMKSTACDNKHYYVILECFKSPYLILRIGRSHSHSKGFLAMSFHIPSQAIICFMSFLYSDL
jgi:hypothetical protein